MPLIASLFALGDSVIDAFNPTTWAFEGSIDVNPGAGNAPGGLWSLAFGGGWKDFFGSRNYGDRDKGLAPLSLCESR